MHGLSDPERKFPWLNFTVLMIVTFSVLWLVHDYLAFFLSLLVPLISFFILMISLITEYLEKSNVPKWYYKLLILMILVPLLTGFVFAGIKYFHFDWRVHPF